MNLLGVSYNHRSSNYYIIVAVICFLTITSKIDSRTVADMAEELVPLSYNALLKEDPYMPYHALRSKRNMLTGKILSEVIEGCRRYD